MPEGEVAPAATAMSDDLLTLSMIVKDEEATLARTLATVRPFVDRWVILDTGSKDRTREVIRREMAGVPGELHEGTFVDFATTRNRALDLAGEATEFVLWLDADDELVGGEALRAFLERERAAQGQDREAYFVRVEMGARFDSPRIFRARAPKPWRFHGAVHEVLTCPDRPPPVHRVPDAMIRRAPGASSVEKSRRRWERDLKLLRRALERDPNDARSAFYLAQTYLWLERHDQAEAAFRRRIALGGWAEELYQAHVGLARIAVARGAPWPVVQARWLDAHTVAPHRAEPLLEIARHYDALGQHALTFLFAELAFHLPLPVRDVLVVDEEAYTWRAADLVGTSAYWIGEFAVGEAAARKASEARPDDERLRKNLGFYLARAGATRAAPAKAIAPPAVEAAPERADLRRIPYEACPLCDAKELDQVRVADCTGHPLYQPGLPAEQRWVRCASCAHVFVDGYFSEAALSLLFSGANPHQLPGHEVEASRYVSARMIERVLAVRPGIGGRWLDVGFGSGSLLTTAAEFGWEVVGLDRREQSVERMRERGFEAHARGLGDFHPEARFDVISLADVLEHLPFPRTALRQAWELLNEEGLLFVSMPNADSFLWQELDRAGTNPYWAELEHLHNFGRRRLHRLLEACGFVPRRYAVSERYRACMEVVAERAAAGG